MLSDADRLPTSVRGSDSGTRRDRSPRAIASAVRSTSTRGRSERRTVHQAMAASTASAITPTTTSIRMSRPTVSSMLCSDCATATDSPPPMGATSTRQRSRPSSEPVVNGSPASSATCAESRSGRSGVEASRPPTGSIDRSCSPEAS